MKLFKVDMFENELFSKWRLFKLEILMKSRLLEFRRTKLELAKIKLLFT